MVAQLDSESMADVVKASQISGDSPAVDWADVLTATAPPAHATTTDGVAVHCAVRTAVHELLCTGSCKPLLAVHG